MIKKMAYILLLPFFFMLTGCKNSKVSMKELSFDDMMGKQMECWQHVCTPLDYSNLDFFKQIYTKKLKEDFTLNEHLRIPKVLHFIWLGPKEFPRESIPNVLSWIKHHPGWEVKFWTDRARNLPSDAMKECFLSSWNNTDLELCYKKSSNYAERSDLMRYEILLSQGGVYVDHDVKCMTSFDSLHDKYELYCGLELPSQTPIPSSIHVTNNIIASRQGHPVLERCVKWIPTQWDEVEALYPGIDKMSVISRIANRTFLAFADSVRLLADKTTNDMVFPAFYFNAPSDEQAIYARHLYAGTWFQTENAFEKMARQRLMMLSKKVNKVLLFSGIAFFVNLLFFIILIIKISQNKRIRDSN